MAHVPAERCLAIIELLADRATELPLGEISERLALPKSGAHRLLSTLVDLGWAEQDRDTGFYRLTMRLAVLGQRFYAASGIPDICQPLLERFAGECREFARLAVVDGDGLVWLAHAQGASGGLVYQPAETTGSVPLFATASGKAWLATLATEQAIRSVFETAASTSSTNTDRTRYGRSKRCCAKSRRRRIADTAWRSMRRSPASRPSRRRFARERRRCRGHREHRGPSVRMTEKRIRELAPRVVQCAAELSALWPLRFAPVALEGEGKDVGRAAAVTA
jgi:DNA-binding IclR family transcriptional regulator